MSKEFLIFSVMQPSIVSYSFFLRVEEAIKSIARQMGLVEGRNGSVQANRQSLERHPLPW